jgi:hypothetical protein
LEELELERRFDGEQNDDDVDEVEFDEEVDCDVDVDELDDCCEAEDEEEEDDKFRLAALFSMRCALLVKTRFDSFLSVCVRFRDASANAGLLSVLRSVSVLLVSVMGLD